MIFPKEIRTYLFSKANDLFNQMEGNELYIRNIDNNNFQIRLEKLISFDNEINNYWIIFKISINIKELQFDNIEPEDLVIGFSVKSSFLMHKIEEMWFKYRGYGHHNAIPCWDEVETAIVAESKMYEYFKEFYGSDRVLCKLQEVNFEKIDILFEHIKKHYFETVEPEIKEKANIFFLDKIINTPYDNYINTNEFAFSRDRIMRKLILAKLANNPDYEKIYEILKTKGDEAQNRVLNERDEELIFSAKNFNVRVDKIHRDLKELEF